MADTVTTCPKCGNLLAVDSYGATSFAPVMPAPQQTAHVAVKNQPAQQLGVAQTIMSTSQPVPPTMASNTPSSPRVALPGPQYVITPAHGSPSPPVHANMPTMQSAMPMPPMAPQTPNPNALAPYAPPPQAPYPPPMSYPMMMQQPGPMSQQQGTPGLAIASLVCGLLGLVPLWIGFVLCLLAITFGGIVLAGTRPGQQGRGLAITGLVLGLLFILPAACGL